MFLDLLKFDYFYGWLKLKVINTRYMSKRTIVTLPGDGIGVVVLKEALRVLDAAGFEADYLHGDIGWEFWCREGNALPQRTLDLIEKHKIVLFGAITSKNY